MFGVIQTGHVRGAWNPSVVQDGRPSAARALIRVSQGIDIFGDQAVIVAFHGVSISSVLPVVYGIPSVSKGFSGCSCASATRPGGLCGLRCRGCAAGSPETSG